MTDSNRSFWSTVPGVVTGVASILTAAVGVLGAGATLGWFGSDDKSEPASSAGTTTTAPPSGQGTTATTRGLLGGSGGGTSATTSSLTPLQATPASMTFDSLGPRDQQVTVRNTSTTALTLRRPTIAGVDSSQFSATDLTCGARLDANRSCEVKVSFLATKSGTSSATLVLQPEGPPALEVTLRGSRLI